LTGEEHNDLNMNPDADRVEDDSDTMASGDVHDTGANMLGNPYSSESTLHMSSSLPGAAKDVFNGDYGCEQSTAHPCGILVEGGGMVRLSEIVIVVPSAVAIADVTLPRERHIH